MPISLIFTFKDVDTELMFCQITYLASLIVPAGLLLVFPAVVQLFALEKQRPNMEHLPLQTCLDFLKPSSFRRSFVILVERVAARNQTVPRCGSAIGKRTANKLAFAFA